MNIVYTKIALNVFLFSFFDFIVLFAELLCEFIRKSYENKIEIKIKKIQTKRNFWVKCQAVQFNVQLNAKTKYKVNYIKK